jgi:Uma2 family endonuclease
MATVPEHPRFSDAPQPAWDVALLFPSQGDWSEFEYLALDTNRLVELVDGNLEVLAMPSTSHQRILWYLLNLFRTFVSEHGLGEVLFAPLALRIRHRTFREPDIIFVANEHREWVEEKFWRGADLVLEIVSPDRESIKRDYDEKRVDYAALGVPEYWIVDPQLTRITVLVLAGKQYRVHGEFGLGQWATSALLNGFAVDVSAAFEAGTKFA